jgi:hypothetical protein
VTERAPNWHQFAESCAREGYERGFDVRRALWTLTDAPDVCVLVDNNPYADDPGRREREHAKFREWLSQWGRSVLAEAGWPVGAEYTRAIVFESDEATIEGARQILDAGITGRAALRLVR